MNGLLTAKSLSPAVESNSCRAHVLKENTYNDMA
jgi:hypothetical protein